MIVTFISRDSANFETPTNIFISCLGSENVGNPFSVIEFPSDSSFFLKPVCFLFYYSTKCGEYYCIANCKN